MWAQDPCPCGDGGGGGPAPPPPGGCPPCPVAIDEKIIFLVIIALLFGIYIIYKQTIKVKTSI
jgi:hypothetical protein